MPHSSKFRRNWRVLCFSALFCLISLQSHAHDAFASDVLAQLQPGGKLSLELKFASVTVEGFTQSISDRDNQVSEDNLPNIRDHLLAQAQGFFQLIHNQQVLVPSAIAVAVYNNDDAVVFTFDYVGIQAGELGIVSEFMTRTNPEFSSTLTVLDSNGVQLGLFIQSPEQRFVEVSIGETPALQANSQGVFSSFFYQGLVHIVIGYDHLLFLFALLIVCRDWRSTLTIVTCFTLAHSVTLSLATLEWINLPARAIEILIALTIVYVGIENLITRHKPKLRWVLTASFGLIHGFGFASVLRDIGLGSEGAPIIMPLFAFNLGVEAGQIAIAAIGLPLLWQARRLRYFETHALPASSVMVSGMGLFWLAARSFNL